MKITSAFLKSDVKPYQTRQDFTQPLKLRERRWSGVSNIMIYTVQGHACIPLNSIRLWRVLCQYQKTYIDDLTGMNPVHAA